MTSRPPTEELVAAGLAGLAEQDKIPPIERFHRMIHAGMIDAEGQVLQPMYVNTPERCSFCEGGRCRSDIFGGEPGMSLSLGDRAVQAGAQALIDSGLLLGLCLADEYVEIARAVLEGVRTL